MRCACYRVDVPSLVTALTQDELLARYAEALTDELSSVADPALAKLIRRYALLAGEVMANGFDALTMRDRGAADALLTDLFAVATWHRWPLPIETLAEQDLPMESLPRGLLGADTSRGAASLWLLDDQTVALARTRTAADTAEELGLTR